MKYWHVLLLSVAGVFLMWAVLVVLAWVLVRLGVWDESALRYLFQTAH